MNIIRPTVITDAMLVSSDVAETDHAPYEAETVYDAGDTVMVTDAGIHKNYESLKNANVGNYPPGNSAGDTPWWLEISATNRWKVFDAKVGSQASQASSMEYVLAPGLIDSIALLNLDATSVGIVVTDPLEGEVYSKTFDLISTVAVTDWYSYFFEPIVRATDLVRTDIASPDLPPYSAATVAITITNTGGTAKCGEIVVGLKRGIGQLLYNPSIGITDYSTKDPDSYGNFTVTERAYSKRLTCDLRVKNLALDETVRQLSLYRATPIVWIGSENYSSLIIYGYYRDFSMVMPGNIHSKCSLEIEGLT